VDFNKPNIDLIILIASCLVLLVYFIKFFNKRSNNSDDDDNNGDGGQFNPSNDPVLDLPPGVTLPTDTSEPELV
jgi:hypothetical protein